MIRSYVRPPFAFPQRCRESFRSSSGRRPNSLSSPRSVWPWLLKWNRVEASAASAPSLHWMHSLALLGEASTHLPWSFGESLYQFLSRYGFSGLRGLLPVPIENSLLSQDDPAVRNTCGNGDRRDPGGQQARSSTGLGCDGSRSTILRFHRRWMTNMA